MPCRPVTAVLALGWGQFGNSSGQRMRLEMHGMCFNDVSPEFSKHQACRITLCQAFEKLLIRRRRALLLQRDTSRFWDRLRRVGARVGANQDPVVLEVGIQGQRCSPSLGSKTRAQDISCRIVLSGYRGSKRRITWEDS